MKSEEEQEVEQIEQVEDQNKPKAKTKKLRFNNFNELVLKNRNVNWFVLFYLSSDDNSGSQLELFEEMAVQFSDEQHQFGKLDIHKNDIPRHGSKPANLK